MIKSQCNNCRYFVKHYGNVSGKFYVITGCGHCLNVEVKNKDFSKVFRNISTCDKWEPEEIQIQLRQESIHDTLRDMVKNLNDIKQILGYDNKKS